MQPNGWRISRRRVKQRAHQSKTRHMTKTGSNEILDQAAGCMRWLGRARPVPDTPLSLAVQPRLPPLANDD
jgi:hypothetical protein